MQRRRVFRVALGYPVIAWGFLEVGDFLVERILGLPEHMQQLVMQLFFAFLAMGYALALYLAWATQLTPEGVRVEPDARLPAFLRGGPRVWLAIAAGMVAAIAAGLWLLDRGEQEVAPVACEGTIGVLPFANFSPSEQDDYPIIEIKSFKIAILSYSFTHNGIAPEPGQEFGLNLVRFNALNDGRYDPSLIHRHIDLAKKRGADYIICCNHWGCEFEIYPAPRLVERARDLLERGERVVLRARVQTRTAPGRMNVVSAAIPGTDPDAGELMIVSHLFERPPTPGGADNSSGVAVTLEIARTLAELIRRGDLPQPRRTLRFLWVPELSGSRAFMYANPELEDRLIAAMNYDMPGEDLAGNCLYN